MKPVRSLPQVIEMLQKGDVPFGTSPFLLRA